MPRSSSLWQRRFSCSSHVCFDEAGRSIRYFFVAGLCDPANRLSEGYVVPGDSIVGESNVRYIITNVVKGVDYRCTIPYTCDGESKWCVPGEIDHIACGPGFRAYSYGARFAWCYECETGFYNDGWNFLGSYYSNVEPCTACPAGKTTAKTGSKSIAACSVPAGKAAAALALAAHRTAGEPSQASLSAGAGASEPSFLAWAAALTLAICAAPHLV